MARGVSFDGSCPFLACFVTDPHSHTACEACGALRYGNLFCPTCVAFHGLAFHGLALVFPMRSADA